MEFTSCVNNHESSIKPSVSTIKIDSFQVQIIDDMINESEIAYLLDTKNHDQKSLIASEVEADNESHSHYNIKYRKSQSVWFENEYEDPVIKCLKKRFATISNKSVDNIEPLQLVQYKYGDYFHSHYDVIENSHICSNPNDKLFDKLCTPTGTPVKREKTLFLVLDTKNLEEERCGGGTVFENIVNANTNKKLRVPPKAGRAIIFDNLTSGNEKHKLSLHGGEELRCEESKKVGLNVWFNTELTVEQTNNLKK